MYKNLQILLACLGFILACKNSEKKVANSQTEENYVLYKNMTIPDYWKDPAVFEIGREKTRTDFIPFESIPLAISGQAVNSKYYKSLSGFWKYSYFPGPDYVPAQYESSNWQQSALETSFPGFMELKGFGKPIFKFENLPFQMQYPQVPTDSNSVIFLQQNLQIPVEWKDRDIFAVFEGISCAYFIYLNGRLIGYNEDSKTSSEYYLNPHLKESGNYLTLVLFRWSDASYFESHNQWHLTGINRDAYLLARPKHRILDFYYQAQYNKNKTNLNLDLSIKFPTDQKSELLKCVVELRSDSNRIINTKHLLIPKPKSELLDVNTSIQVQNIKPWSDETPVNYQLFIHLLNDQDQLVEVVQYPIAFRSLQYGQDGLKLNGRKIWVKGAVCHEFHPTNGNILDKAWIENDADVLKLQSINAVRNSHYPFPSYWYRYMQKFGIYILDEANVNCIAFHHQNQEIPTDSAFSKILKARVVNMFERNKNYQNILCWSLGYGISDHPGIKEAYTYIKKRDPIRPVAAYSTRSSCGDICLTDATQLSSNPSQCQLVYQMATNQGNGMGGMFETWNSMRSRYNNSGGFIADFTDQTFMMKGVGEKLFFAYGGAFGEEKSDSFRCVQGIMTSNKTPKPPTKTAHEAFSNFSFKIIDLSKGIIEITNNHVFFEDTVFKYFWSIDENKNQIKSGHFQNLRLRAGEKRKIQIDWEDFKPDPSKYTLLHLIVNKSSKVNGFFRFQDVAHAQFEFPHTRNTSVNKKGSESWSVDRKGSEIQLRAGDYSVTIDTLKPSITNIQLSKINYLHSPLKPLFSRAPVDNDILSGHSEYLTNWLNSWDSFTPSSCILSSLGSEGIGLRIEGKMKMIDSVRLIVKMEFYTNKEIKLGLEFPDLTKETSPPKIAWIAQVPSKFGNIKWFGRGPYDSFKDRWDGLLLGEFKTTAVEFNVPLVRPQEMGIKSDLRWAAVSSFEGKTLAAYSEVPFEIMVLPFAYHELFGKHKYGTDIKVAEFNTVAFGGLQAPVSHGIGQSKKPRCGYQKFELKLKITDDQTDHLWSHYFEAW